MLAHYTMDAQQQQEEEWRGRANLELLVEESRVQDAAMLSPFLAFQSHQSISNQIFRVRSPDRLRIVPKFRGEHFFGLMWMGEGEARLRSIPIYKSFT